jgi:peroxiredoxin
LYHTSLKWPAVPERDMVTALYVSEVQRVASLQSPFASRLRESKDLIRRLDSVVTRLGRVPSKWPACLRENSSLLVRHFLHEVEQASSNLVIDASFPITGGSEMALRDLRGRLVVIAFWRTDCSGCQPLREAINRINQPIGRGGRWIFAVSDQPEADVLATLDDNPFWASIPVDSSARLARTFGIRNVPTVIVVDRAGRLAARIEAEWNAETAAFDFPLDVLQRALAAAGQ